MQLVFTNTFFELILLFNGLAILLYYAARKKKKQRAMMFGNYRTLEKVAGEDFLKKNDLLLVLQILAMTSLFLAVSEPALEKEVTGANSDYVITLDSSATMLQQDYDPSRLGAAKQASKDFLKTLPNETEIGVISYSGKIDSQRELTNDREAVVESIDNASLGEEAGSAMADALISSSTLLLDSDENREVLLLSDGRNNVGTGVNESIRVANNQNVTINTIGIGLNQSNEERWNRMNLIANRTGGNFTKVEQDQNIGESLIDLEKETTQENLTVHFIMIGLFMLLIKWSLGTTRYDILP